jgi:hypothetical protein
MNKYICLALSFVVFISGSCFSQITVRDDVTTDSVNLFTQYDQTFKSSNIAIAASLILPGSGHQYLGRNKSALAYLAVDIFSLVGAIYSEKYSRKLNTDSRGFAGLYASATGGDDLYWQAVGEYDDVKSYNDAIDLNREKDKRYDSESKLWFWANPDDRTEFNEMRKTASKYHLVSAICIGAMVLNRVVSVVDIRSSSKYKVVKGVASMKIVPSISSDLSSAGILMSATF